MKKPILQSTIKYFLSFCFLLSFLISLSAQTTYFVKSGSAGDGSSWNNALGSLQAAISMAVAGDAIWVAAGVYYPTAENGTNAGSGSQDRTFYIDKDVKIYGGFQGNEATLSARSSDLQANKTILSGDIDLNDIVDGEGITDSYTRIVGLNAFHIVTLSGVTNNMILDRLYLTGGDAKGSYPENFGGGIYNIGLFGGNISNPIITDCAFIGNRAEYGGGIFNDGLFDGHASPMIQGCSFFKNFAIYSGAGIYNYGFDGLSSPTITECVFEENIAETGAAIYNDGVLDGQSSPTVANSVFAGNNALIDGGAVYNDGRSGNSEPNYFNCVFRGNRASDNGGGMVNDGGNYNDQPPGVNNTSVINCSFSGNEADLVAGAMLNRVGVSSSEATGGTIDKRSAAHIHIQDLPTSSKQKYRSSSSNTTIVNTIIWNNKDFTGTGTASSSLADQNAGSTITYSLIEGQTPFGQGNLDGTVAANDPLFAEPVNPDNAATTDGNLQPDECSTAINAGLNSASFATGINTDVIDNNRIVGGTVDIGAYEFQGANPCVFPLEWLDFDAKITANQEVELTWSTAQEINVKHYIVEWSKDGEHFEEIDLVIATGTQNNNTNNYTSLHSKPGKGLNYYRIQQIDNNRQFSYSSLQTVFIEKEVISLYPNPVKDKIWIQGIANLPVPIQLFNATGQLLRSINTTIDRPYLNMKDLPNGIYFLHILNHNEPEVYKISKQ